MLDYMGLGLGVALAVSIASVLHAPGTVAVLRAGHGAFPPRSVVFKRLATCVWTKAHGPVFEGA